MTQPQAKSAVQHRIEALTTELRLPTVRKMYHRLAQEVSRQGGDYEAYLMTILQEEASERATRRVERRLKEARLPQVKLLSELDYDAESIPPKAQLAQLATGAYIEDGRNVIALGSPGTGKTHVATALAVEACRQGLRVRFYPVATLAAELQAAAEDHQLHRFLHRFATWDLVVLDELGYLPLSRTGAELLFQAISERTERASLIITSNLPFTDWTEIFVTERLTAALLDRVTYRAIILQMNGPSYRLRRTLAGTRLSGRTGSPTGTRGRGDSRSGAQNSGAVTAVVSDATVALVTAEEPAPAAAEEPAATAAEEPVQAVASAADPADTVDEEPTPTD